MSKVYQNAMVAMQCSRFTLQMPLIDPTPPTNIYIPPNAAVLSQNQKPIVADPAPSDLVFPQALPDAFPTSPAEVLIRPLPLFPEQFRRLEVRRALVVGVLKQADHAEQDSLGRLHGAPPLARALVPVLVLLWRMQDADAQLTVRVDVGVERYRTLEHQFRRHQGVVGGEAQVGAEVASWKDMGLLVCLAYNGKGHGGKAARRCGKNAYRRSICSRR